MRPPVPLIAIAVVYLASEVLSLIYVPKLMGFVRIAIYSIVFLFAFRGSRGAAKIWGIMSILGGVVSGFGAMQIFQTNPDGSLLLTLYATFFFISSAYIFFSPGLRSFHERSESSDLQNEL